VHRPARAVSQLEALGYTVTLSEKA